MIPEIETSKEDISQNNDEYEIESVVDWYSGVTQFLSWPIIFILSKVFLDLNIHGRNNLKIVKKPYIIVSNHISFYDSFLFRIILGLWTTHLPLRFMAVEKFDWIILNLLQKIGIIKLVYMLYGVFTVLPGKGINENIKKPVNIIKNKGIVVIYPEGKIVTNNEIAPFKKGAAVLHRLTGSSILPVCFKKNTEKSFRKKIDIFIGPPINLIEGMDDSSVTESLRNTIISLNKKIV
jgi:1-acyl-sn-glycerol-3-phosphate acyltransferase